MTGEEMAEQYAVENWEHYEEGQTDYKALKQAFLAGLKAGLATIAYMQGADNQKKKADKQLTEAIEIIRKLYNGVCGSYGCDFESIEQAEQFLKEMNK